MFRIESSGLRCPRNVLDENQCPKIKRLLIANRGEIACRIIKTCKSLGIHAISIYSDEDCDSLHVSEADEAIPLGPIHNSGGNVYQDIDLLVQTATSTRADAIHPGYGYLSENAAFAAQVIASGIIFVGPTPTGISTLGDKRAAKSFLREKAPEVPLIPGYNGKYRDYHTLSAEADNIGYPVLIKASAGGGGKGMRIVRQRDQFREEFSRAQSEAERSFKSSDCFIEKFIEHGKHIEIQIIGDKYGNVMTLLDRDCSVQRRHQKIIEESPCTWIEDGMRRKMSDAAVTVARLIQYEGAGTVEFIVDMSRGTFHFLEVNTRIQVEHPITEEVVDVDIVGLQLFVAAGGNLDTLDLSLEQRGHAIECRLCAEDPDRDFLPDMGKIWRWQPDGTTRATSRVRFETSIRTGSVISVHFDSMIAKIIVWATTRQEAIDDMISVLANSVLLGVKTNQAFLGSCLLHSTFESGLYTTSFIPNYIEDLKSSSRLNSSLLEDLTIFPVLLLRHLPSKVLNPFKNVSRGFRNQVADKASLQADIITIRSDDSPNLIVWSPFKRNLKESHLEYNVEPLEINSNAALRPNISGFSSKDRPATAKETLPYHYSSTISQAIKSYRGKPKFGKIIDLSIKPVDLNSVSWLIADLVLEINGKRVKSYLATDSDHGTDEIGQPQRIFCHFPQEKVTIEFHRYSRLQYSELRRPLSQVDGRTEKVSKAPMPCTVLQVLKQNGEEVEAGDVVMVVESMKMEMKIIAAIKGKFQSQLKNGQAVQEGSVLCIIE